MEKEDRITFYILMTSVIIIILSFGMVSCAQAADTTTTLTTPQSTITTTITPSQTITTIVTPAVPGPPPAVAPHATSPPQATAPAPPTAPPVAPQTLLSPPPAAAPASPPVAAPPAAPASPPVAAPVPIPVPAPQKRSIYPGYNNCPCGPSTYYEDHYPRVPADRVSRSTANCNGVGC